VTSGKILTATWKLARKPILVAGDLTTAALLLALRRTICARSYRPCSDAWETQRAPTGPWMGTFFPWAEHPPAASPLGRMLADGALINGPELRVAFEANPIGPMDLNCADSRPRIVEGIAGF
jgi:hypothetical protein